ncbi:anthranilate synthase component I family protein [Lacrimispora sp. 210928-DFI.3.58]|uniref:anthranilate synthase component I family protein n=1 Tax=Lacrimispora sp. 210928-DFI.3.58 TaxID=2883214 RepID=UPI001D05DCAB|nr:chorismate-binding protein [Lacrimispora sp. 210928-DFI.3.58]MCB7320900.1 chorismate-binding protein [Lacrimispora sp. 210928-DFI.3.58]
MMVPTCEEILKLADNYDIIPVCSEVYADVVTPITLLRRIAERSSRFYLLESIEGGEKWGRYSFLGYDPIMRVTLKQGKVSIESRTEDFVSKTLETDKPYDVLRNILKKYKSPRLKGQPPFTGGFVGYFSYAMIEYAEPTLHITRGDANDFDLMLFDKVIAYDHLKQKIEIVVNMKTGRRTGAELGTEAGAEPGHGAGLDFLMGEYGKACAEIEAITALINDSAPLKKLASTEKPNFTCNVSKDEYCRVVEKTKEYILDGDIFQAVISRQFTSPYEGSLLNAYRVLRTTNPSPYMVYMNIDGDEIISTSPETLIRLENGRLTTFPVAGSRPRGATEELDKELEAELLADEKELAEHNMLVDLGRNDIGRIASFGSVEVTEYQMIHRYSKIMHICSQVEGDIRPECDGCSAIESLLLAGTLSGAPKIRACEIIEELEQVPRGVYGGALGYLDFTGNLDTCIAIRMAVKQNGRVTVQAGGGIVADSVPESEYQESANKAGAVIQAIINAGEVNDR